MAEETQVLSLRMRIDEVEELEMLAESEGFHSKSDLLRDLIRKRWDEYFRKAREHYRNHPEEYVTLEKIEKKLEERERHVLA